MISIFDSAKKLLSSLLNKRNKQETLNRILSLIMTIILLIIAVIACATISVDGDNKPLPLAQATTLPVATTPTASTQQATIAPTTTPTEITEAATTEPATEPTVAPTEPTVVTEPTVQETISTDWQPREEDVVALAKTIWGEARGVTSKSEQAAVAWCILNRLDSGRYGSTILRIVSAPGQFVGYSSSFPVTDEFRELAIDVLQRWHAEKEGQTNVGRTLPSDYYYFSGYRGRNYFTQSWQSYEYWDWSLESPYES